MKTNRCVRPNPLLSFTVSPEEYKKLKNIAEERGVTIAQVGRGYFRLATEALPLEQAKYLSALNDAIRLGAF